MRVLAALILFLIASPVMATNYYVLENGTGDCSSWSSPCDDIGDVSGEGANDTIYYGKGTYTDIYSLPGDDFTIRRATSTDHGTNTGWNATTMEGVVEINPSSTPYIDTNGYDGFTFDGGDYDLCELDGQSLRNKGFYINGTTGLTISGVEIHHFKNLGVDSYQSYAPAMFDGLHVHENGLGSNESQNCGLMLQDIVGFDWSTQFTTVKNSYIHDAGYTSPYGDTDQICGTRYMKIHDNYIAETRNNNDSSDSISTRYSNVKIYNNVFYKGRSGCQLIFLSGDTFKVENVWLYNNFFYKDEDDNAMDEVINATCGRNCGNGATAPGCHPVKNLYFLNNTVAGHFDVGFRGSEHWESSAACGTGDDEKCADNIVIKNNIFANEGTYSPGTRGILLGTNILGDAVIDNNYYAFGTSADVLRVVTTDYTLAEAQSSLSIEANGDQGTSPNFDATTPGFSGITWSSGFKLTSISTDLIDMVVAANDFPSDFTTDYFNNSRTTGSWDVGAHEFQSGGGDDVDPTVSITSPTASATYDNGSTSTITLGGTASDETALDRVEWSNADSGGSGTASGTTTWTAASISLVSGTNAITVTAYDEAENSSTDLITVTYTPPAPDPTTEAKSIDCTFGARFQ